MEALWDRARGRVILGAFRSLAAHVVLFVVVRGSRHCWSLPDLAALVSNADRRAAAPARAGSSAKAPAARMHWVLRYVCLRTRGCLRRGTEFWPVSLHRDSRDARASSGVGDSASAGGGILLAAGSGHWCPRVVAVCQPADVPPVWDRRGAYAG